MTRKLAFRLFALLASSLSASAVCAQEKPKIELVQQIGHAGDVNSVAYSPDGKLALSGGLDGSVKLWDVGSGRLLRNFEAPTGGVDSVAFSPDGSRVLSGNGYGTITQWNTVDGRLLGLSVDTQQALNPLHFHAMEFGLRPGAMMALLNYGMPPEGNCSEPLKITPDT